MRLIFCILISLSFSAAAQVYKWTDENGVTHFGSQPPPGQQEEVAIRESSPGSMGAERRVQPDVVRQASRLEKERREKRRAAQMNTSIEDDPEDSWGCQYSKEQVEEYEILLRELGRRGYRQSEKNRLESYLRAAEREVERDCN
ncbi:DUF4124 domain-containing protein [uncultured Marinobacter sp.]|uniref:DUF4124 domain-containing protein n=1 Tax=uncultured Marinobacter sp. TaxID=187379 RepID=UPI0030DC05F8